MAFFEATDSFDSALSEVEHLLALAEKSQARRNDYLTYLKAAFVLLGAKFEAFSENIIENFIDQLSELNLKAKHIPREIRIHSTTLLLNECIKSQGFSAKAIAIANLEKASGLWNDEKTHSTLTVSSKFNYGKHGSSEVRSLFQRIGIDDIFCDCQVTPTQENTMLGVAPERIPINPDIDSFTNIRNNIIHNDSNPGNITHQQIHDYKEKMWEFSYAVDLRLEKALYSVAVESAANP